MSTARRLMVERPLKLRLRAKSALQTKAVFCERLIIEIGVLAKGAKP
jgi:hypothetical protein